MNYTKQIEEEKLRVRARKSKRAQVDGGGYSHQMSRVHNKFQGGKKARIPTQSDKLPISLCRRPHKTEWLARSNEYFKFEKPKHHVRDSRSRGTRCQRDGGKA